MSFPLIQHSKTCEKNGRISLTVYFFVPLMLPILHCFTKLVCNGPQFMKRKSLVAKIWLNVAKRKIVTWLWQKKKRFLIQAWEMSFPLIQHSKTCEKNGRISLIVYCFLPPSWTCICCRSKTRLWHNFCVSICCLVPLSLPRWRQRLKMFSGLVP